MVTKNKGLCILNSYKTENMVTKNKGLCILNSYNKNDLTKLDEIPCDDIEIEIESPLTAYEMTASVETPE
jgi:hypothetical protein